MNFINQNIILIIQNIILLIHMILIFIVGYILFFNNDIIILGILSICLILTYIQIIFFGCMLNKCNDKLPFLNITLLEIVQKCFFLPECIEINYFEKIFVGFTLMGCLGKIGLLLFIPPKLKNKINIFINNFAKNIAPEKYHSYSYWE